jgi:hypothetical protein
LGPSPGGVRPVRRVPHFINPHGPNILIDLPPAIANFPGYVASGFDPNSQAAQNIKAAGYPPDLVSGTVSLWGLYWAQFWEVTQCQWQKRFDPGFTTYADGLNNVDGTGGYDYLARVVLDASILARVAAVATTGKIKKPLITVAGTMDALLPIDRGARAYEAVEFIQPHAQKALDLLVDHVENHAPLPPSQCIPKGGTIAPNPSEPGHCMDLLVP